MLWVLSSLPGSHPLHARSTPSVRATDVPKHHTVSPGGSTAPGPCLRGGRAQGRHPQWEIGCQPWLWTGKQRPREGEQLAQGHTPGEKQTRDASPEPHPGTGTLVLHEALTSAGPAGPGARPAQSEAPSPAPRAAGQRACHCADEAEGPGGSLRPSFLLTVAGTFTATHGKPQRRPRRPLQGGFGRHGQKGGPPGAGGAGPCARSPPGHAPGLRPSFQNPGRPAPRRPGGAAAPRPPWAHPSRAGVQVSAVPCVPRCVQPPPPGSSTLRHPSRGWKTRPVLRGPTRPPPPPTPEPERRSPESKDRRSSSRPRHAQSRGSEGPAGADEWSGEPARGQSQDRTPGCPPRPAPAPPPRRPPVTRSGHLPG